MSITSLQVIDKFLKSTRRKSLVVASEVFSFHHHETFVPDLYHVFAVAWGV